MKVSFNRIISGLVVGTVLVTGLLSNTPVKAESVQSPVNGVVRSTTIDFFNQGRVQFERELNLLTNPKKSSEPILTVSPELQPIQEQLKPLERSERLPEVQKSEHMGNRVGVTQQ